MSRLPLHEVIANWARTVEEDGVRPDAPILHEWAERARREGAYAELLQKAGRDVVHELQHADQLWLRRPLTKLIAAILALDVVLAKNPPGSSFPNIRILNRGAPDSVVIRFVRDITNDEVEAVGKALVVRN